MEFNQKMFEDAIIFATQKYSGMKRKGTDRPYILHPLEVAAIVNTMTNDYEILAAAVLHDVVEDTGTGIMEIRQRFGDTVADLVASESENKREEQPAEQTWQIRKQETIDHLMSEDRIGVKMIALGDKLSNVRAMQRDYAELGEALWNRFNQKDKSKHAWYYRSIAASVKELSGYPAWLEYDLAVKGLFGI